MVDNSVTANGMTPAEILQLLRGETGFSAELKAFDVVLQAGFVADSNVYYRDRTENKVREADIFARLEQKCVLADSNSAAASLILVCDVKSTSAPTVILSSPPAGPERQATFFSELYYSDHETLEAKAYPGRRWKLHEKTSARIGRVLLKVLSSSERKDKNRVNEDWYRGYLFSIIGATEYFVSAFGSDLEMEFLFSEKPFHLVQAMPMLIIDGPLFELSYRDGVEHFAEVQNRIVRVSLPKAGTSGNSDPVVNHRLVTVCSLAGLPQYLAELKRWFETQAQSNFQASVDRYTNYGKKAKGKQRQIS